MDPGLCECDPRGTLSDTCSSSGECECRDNVEGRHCDRCRPGTFLLRQSHQAGCLNCYCSGVTQECGEAVLYWSTLRMPIYDQNHGFRLTDKRQSLDKRTELELVNSELRYRYSGRERMVYYWELPHQFLGNKITAYGGNMTVVQRFTVAGSRAAPLSDSDVIMIGNGLGKIVGWFPFGLMLYFGFFGLFDYGTNHLMNLIISALHYVFDYDRSPNEMERHRIPIYEEGWTIRRGSAGRPVTREEYLRVLSSIDTILVRASVARNIESAAISRVNMDIAVPQVTGGPPTQGAEECRCPRGYRGFSCEECSVGYYRDPSDMVPGPLGACVKCPCNDNEQACGLGQSGRVECRCKDGWDGAYCDTRGKYKNDIFVGLGNSILLMA